MSPHSTKTWFVEAHPALQALLACLFTRAVTALGASVVFFFRDLNRVLLDTMMGFAAGVMIAASFWSLLAPAIDRGGTRPRPGARPANPAPLARGVSHG